MNKEKLSDYAHDTLKRMILDNTFKPGQHLDEVTLCSKLNISRTPLREALNRLVYERLLISVPQKGILVPELTVQDVTEIFKARKVIEPMVIMLSAPRMNMDVLMEFKGKTIELINSGNSGIKEIHELDYNFHDYINKCCHNRYLYYYTTYISEQFQRVRTQDFYPIERALNGAKEHLDIIDSLLCKDYEPLPQLMLNHIKSTEKYYYRRIVELDDELKIKNINFIKENFSDFN